MRRLSFILALSSLGVQAAITLTSTPLGMKKTTDVITVGWTGGGDRVHLRASTVPGGKQGKYDSLHLPGQSASATYSFRINTDIPAAYRGTDLRYGANYCVVSDGVNRSAEFILLIESSQAPVPQSPVNAAVLTNPTPSFSWTGQAPFYTLLVSDQPFKISDSGTVTGISAIWQILTPQNSARYGDADPSGLSGIQAPPLVAGKVYNWLVLNNYTGTSGGTSKVASTPQSFTYSPSVVLAKPVLTAPKSGDTLQAPDNIDFAWNTVSGAVSYKVELLEENQVDGSQADLVVWKTAVTGNKARLSGASSLLRRYRYKWRVYALDGSGSASLSDNRNFFYAIAVANLQVKTVSTSGQAIPYASIKLSRIGAASSSVYQSGSTDGAGSLEVQNAVLGSYEARSENVGGYLNQVDTIRHAGPGKTTATLTLKPAAGRIIGRIRNAAGVGLLAAKVTASMTGANGNATPAVAQSNSQGDYQITLPLGSYSVVYSANGYESALKTLALGAATPQITADAVLNAKPYTLTALVTNAYTQKPLLGAKVSLEQAGKLSEAFTDGAGAARFSLSGDNAVLSVSASGFSAPKPVTLKLAADKTQSMALEPGASLVSGRVRNPQKTSLAQAQVRAIPSKGLALTATADAQGYYELSVGAGDWILEAEKPGFTSAGRVGFSLESGRTMQDVDLILQANPCVAVGRVVVQGTGLAGATVYSGSATTLSDAAGYFRLSLADGKPVVKAQKTGYLFGDGIALSLSPGDSAVGLSLQGSANAGGVSGTVYAAGQIVGEPQITAISAAGIRKTAAGNLSGAFAIDLQPGTYKIFAEKKGFLAKDTLNAQILAGSQSAGLTLNLKTYASKVYGRVRNGNVGLPGCSLNYQGLANGNPSGLTQSDADGSYQFQIQPGLDYQLTATCKGFQGQTQTLLSPANGQERLANFDMLPASARVSGKAVDNQNKGLNGVTLSAQSGSAVVKTMTDIDGGYGLDLGSGTWLLTFSKTGWKDRQRSLLLPGAVIADLRDTLAPAQARLSIRVDDGEQPLANAWVKLLPVQGGSAKTSATGFDGRVDFGSVAAGGYQISAEKTGFTSGLIGITLAADQATQSTMTLKPSRAALSGRVSRGGNGFAGATVALSGPGINRFTESQSDGAFHIDSLPAGTYQMQAYAEGYGSQDAYDDLALAENETKTGLALSISALSGSLEGTLSGVDNPNGFVLILKGSQGLSLVQACDATGYFRFSPLPEDRYTLKTEASGWQVEGDIGGPGQVISDPLDLDVRVKSAVYSLRGALKNQAGNNLAGIAIQARGGNWQAQTLTDDQGQYRFSAVPVGSAIQLGCQSQKGLRDCRDTVLQEDIAADAGIAADLFALDRSGNLRGTLYLDGKPLRDAPVLLRSENNNQVVTTGDDGAWQFTGIAFGEAIHLIGEAVGASRLDTLVNWAVGENPGDLMFRLMTKTPRLAAQVVDETNRPLAGLNIVLDFGRGRDTARTGDDGRAVFENLPAYSTGTLRALLAADDYESSPRDIRLGEEDTSLTLAVVSHKTRITVKVVDASGQGLESAQVWKNGKAVGTVAGGVLEVAHLPAGVYRFSATKAGYTGEESPPVSVRGDTSLSLELVLTAFGDGISGRLSDSIQDADGKSGIRYLAGALVEAETQAGVKETYSDASGHFVFNSLTSGDILLKVSVPGHFSLEKTVRYAGGSAREDLFIPALPGSFSGRILGGKEAGIVAIEGLGAGKVSARSEKNGWFALLGLRRNTTYFLQARDKEDDHSASAPLTVVGHADAALGGDLQLAPAGNIKVHTREASKGFDLSGVTVWLISEGKRLSVGHSDADGRVSLSELSAGDYTLVGELPGFISDTLLSVRLTSSRASDTADLTLASKQPLIGGQVTDIAGRGLASEVALLATTGNPQTTATDADGYFRFLQPPAGNYRVRATARGFSTLTSDAFDYGGREGRFLSLPLSTAGDSLRLWAVDATNQRPIQGIQATLILPKGKDSSVTDSLGMAGLDWSGEAGGKLSLSSEDYHPIRDLVVRHDSATLGLLSFQLNPDYRFDGSIRLTVSDKGHSVPGAVVQLTPLSGGDAPVLSVTSDAANSFPGLRVPGEYKVAVRRSGYAELSRVVALSRQNKDVDFALRYPSSSLLLQVTSDGSAPQSGSVTMNGQSIVEADQAGLYAYPDPIQTLRPVIQILTGQDRVLLPDPFTVWVGEDTLRTDTVSLAFTADIIPDTSLESDIPLRVRRKDSLQYSENDVCSLFVRPKDGAWKAIALEGEPAGFSGTWTPDGKPGSYQAYYQVTSAKGLKTGIRSGDESSSQSGALVYSNRNQPQAFTLRDPRILRAVRLLPASAEADTLTYPYGGKDKFEVQLSGEGTLSLDAFVDDLVQRPDGERPFAVTWSVIDADEAADAGIALASSASSPRLATLSVGKKNTRRAIELEAAVKLGSITLRKHWFIRVRDLTPVAIGILYQREGRELSRQGPPLTLANPQTEGYRFEAFAQTAEGERFRIRPTWSLGADTAAGSLDQDGLFIPKENIPREALLNIRDTLMTASGPKAFDTSGSLRTEVYIAPADSGVKRLSNGEGLRLEFPLGGLTKAFTVSVGRPKVNPLLRSSPGEEVVGDVHEIELSESQPFKPDSGAWITLPVAKGMARERKVYVGHWNAARLAWEKVDSTQADTAVSARVASFSKYAVIMGSLPLGAYDFSVTPNPFSPRDPWGLQLHYTLGSEVSSQVGVRIEIFNMVGDKVFSSHEVLVGKGEEIRPGLFQAAPQSPDRRQGLAPYVWDGRDDKGEICRNGRYLLRLVVRDGNSSKEYLRKVVLIQ